MTITRIFCYSLFCWCVLGSASLEAQPGSRLFGYVTFRNVKMTAMAMKSDAKIAMLGFSTGHIAVFDPLPGRFIQYELFMAHNKGVTAADISPDDKWIATAGNDGIIKIWDLQAAYKFQLEGQNRKEGAPKPIEPTPKLVIKDAHKKGINSVVFHRDGALLASGGSDGLVKIWSLEMGKLQTTIEAHKLGINTLAYAPDGSALASASDDKTFKVWNLADPTKPQFVSPEHQGPVLAVIFSPDGKSLASGSGEAKKTGQLQVWNIEKNKLAYSLSDLLGEPVSTISFHPKLARLAASGLDKKIRVWNLTTKKILYVDEHGEPIVKISYSGNGNVLGSISANEGKWWNANPKLK